MTNAHFYQSLFFTLFSAVNNYAYLRNIARKDKDIGGVGVQKVTSSNLVAPTIENAHKLGVLFIESSSMYASHTGDVIKNMATIQSM